jgi:hypothetical protein
VAACGGVASASTTATEPGADGGGAACALKRACRPGRRAEPVAEPVAVQVEPESYAAESYAAEPESESEPESEPAAEPEPVAECELLVEPAAQQLSTCARYRLEAAAPARLVMRNLPSGLRPPRC